MQKMRVRGVSAGSKSVIVGHPKPSMWYPPTLQFKLIALSVGLKSIYVAFNLFCF